ncbi:MAG: potassium-transporting ATPase subunit KdpC [Giesbergeria sp.]
MTHPNILETRAAEAAPNNTGGLLRPALVLFAVLSLVTGLLYPLAVTGVAQAVFPTQANGSLVQLNGKVVGSELIGQQFSNPRYFWGRPSATSPMPYNAQSSGGSNLGASSPDLKAAVEARVTALRQADPSNTALVPVDLVTASGSGLDPHISAAAARYQLVRVAKSRAVAPDTVVKLLDAHTEVRWFGFFGEPRVNVLRLNMALDETMPSSKR